AEVREPEPAPAEDLAGKWLMDLAGGILSLILVPSGERLQGYGMLERDGSEIPVTATGSFSGEVLSLRIRPSMEEEYRLEMASINGTLQGGYELLRDERSAERGNVTARRSG
ncbi:MAG: hypothetical protein QUS08_08445, partial [Methanothrix sp.]|nr:hypothetical protein [Methanothrix sp.]